MIPHSNPDTFEYLRKPIMETPNQKTHEEQANITIQQDAMREMMHYIQIGDYYKIKERHFEALKFWRKEQCEKLRKEINED